jgi:hypothetical protein
MTFAPWLMVNTYLYLQWKFVFDFHMQITLLLLIVTYPFQNQIKIWCNHKFVVEDTNEEASSLMIFVVDCIISFNCPWMYHCASHVIISTIKSKLWDERQYVLDYFDLILIMNQYVITPYVNHIMNLCNYWCFKKVTCVNMVTIQIYVCNSFNNILKNQKWKVNVGKAWLKGRWTL